MKKLLLSITGCLALSAAFAPQAEAITAQDLDGKYYGAFMRGMRPEATFPKEQFAGKFEMRNGKLYMVDFWRAFDIPVTVSSNSITIPNGYYADNGNGVWNNSTMRFTQAKGYSYNGGSYIDYGYAKNSNAVTIYLSSTSVDCDYCFATDGTHAVNMSISQNGQEIFADGHGLQVYVFDTNTKATEFEGNTVSDTYGVDIQLDPNDNTKATIKNWGYWGINYTNYAQSGNNQYNLYWLNATIDYDKGTFTIPRQAIGGDFYENTDYLGHGYLHSYTANWYRWYGDLIQPYSYYAASGTSGSGGDIVGKIVGSAPYHKTVDENYWSKRHGGSLETWQRMNIEFGAMQTYSERAGTMVYVDKTIYETPFEYECTHDLSSSLSITGTGVDNAGQAYFNVEVTLSGFKNMDHVDYWDVYLIPGIHTHYSTVDHSKAQKLYSQSASEVEDPAEEHTVYKQFVPKEVVWNEAENKYDYPREWTAYVVAHYKDAATQASAQHRAPARLEDTFHALSSDSFSGVITGVDEVGAADAGIVISTVNGGIKVDGFDGIVEVYAVSGAQVYTGAADATINVAPGLYIVKAGTKAEKVNVR